MIKLAFYKASGDLTDKVIRLWTGSPYSHCELILPDGRWISSSPRDGGVRAKRIEFNADVWDVIELPWADAGKIERFYEQEKGHHYDWLGIIGCQILGAGWQSSTRWTCSEFCAAALDIKEPETYSPGDLADLYLCTLFTK